MIMGNHHPPLRILLNHRLDGAKPLVNDGIFYETYETTGEEAGVLNHQHYENGTVIK